jgi:hypothetical protein
MLRNIHLGGAFSGIRSISRSKSKPPERDARRLTTTADVSDLSRLGSVVSRPELREEAKSERVCPCLAAVPFQRVQQQVQRPDLY